jgi:two-component system, chemotaxis family, CheB/CheR fusion protein
MEALERARDVLFRSTRGAPDSHRVLRRGSRKSVRSRTRRRIVGYPMSRARNAKSKKTMQSTQMKQPRAEASAKPGGDSSAGGKEGPLVVVGIGSSAGGLEAIQQLLDALPPDLGMAYVHVQHLDPHHKSMMADLLAGVTSMPVREATDRMTIEPNCVYVGPPNHDVAIVGGQIHLVEQTEERRTRLPIDFFLRSLARDRGDRAIGVILSGAGTDGALGIRAIKGAGGMTIAQDPRSAGYDGMPRSAIATQLIDVVTTPREIPKLLRGYAKHPYITTPESAAHAPAAAQILAILREHTGHDFTHYKQNTIRRRIERRMAVHQLTRLDDYLRQLQRLPGEVDALFKDLLIGVTSFFRDAEAFRVIEDQIVARLVETSAGSGQIRVWVPSCSTGEEAYSIAMLIAEHLDRAHQTRKVSIFATDIDPSAIDVARAALYPDSIAADVSADRLTRHFVQENSAYRIHKRIREMVIFAVQDVLKDPPFSRIDLISCRNLLIYLESELQERLMQLFHAVLNPRGVLFLGASETVGDAAELFLPVDKKWKVFEKKAVPTHPIVGVTALHRLNEGLPAHLREIIEAPAHVVEPPGIAQITARSLLDTYAPACVVVDEHYDVVYLQGRTGRYLDLPVGEPRLNLLHMARDELLRELRTALHKATKEQIEAVRDRVVVTADGTSRYLRLRIKPLRGPGALQHLFLVAFEESEPAQEADGATGGGQPVDPRVNELERRLAAMKESLQSTVEEVETSNEELRSTNEELQSANEELQSTNEELETSKEELQSVNEELMTVNNELQKKLEELSHTNNDLTNLLNSTEIGTIFLNNEFRIKRFTPSVAKLVNLIPSDVGRPISDIVTQVLDDNLVEHAREVLRTLVFEEAEVRTKDGRTFLRRILPYRTVDNVIDGVVVTFVNITEVREAQRMVEAMLTHANTIMNSVRQPILLLSKEGRVVQVNQACYDVFRLRKEDVIGSSIYDIDGGRWGAPAVRSLVEAAVASDGGGDGQRVNQDLPGLGPRTLRLYAKRSQFGTKAVAGEQELTLFTVEDVTSPKG